MPNSYYDSYADEERLFWLSESRLRFMGAMQIVSRVAAIVGVTLIAATYVEPVLVFHRYDFLIAEQAALAIYGSLALVLAGNAVMWSSGRPGSPLNVIAKALALTLASPVVTFFLVLVIRVTASQCWHSVN